MGGLLGTTAQLKPLQPSRPPCCGLGVPPSPQLRLPRDPIQGLRNLQGWGTFSSGQQCQHCSWVKHFPFASDLNLPSLKLVFYHGAVLGAGAEGIALNTGPQVCVSMGAHTCMTPWEPQVQQGHTSWLYSLLYL